MTYKIVLLSRAEAELADIVVRHSERSSEGAIRWLDAFDAAQRLLSRNPQSCELAPEDDLVNEEIRQTFFQTRRGQPYRAVFTILNDEVRVLHIRGPNQRTLLGGEL